MNRRIPSAAYLNLARVCVLLVMPLLTNGGLVFATPAAGARAAARTTRLHRAARADNVPLLQSLLDRGANPNARDRDGRTPLMDAARAGHVDAMRALLLGGAKVNAWSRAGSTALIEAAARGHADAVRLLIDSGADLNHRQRGWGTAVEAAERTGHSDVAQMLRAAGARSSGRSVGDTVCVRPWGGEGFCGVVQSVNKIHYRIRVTEIRGCKDGCAARAECSAGRAVGVLGGVTVGFELTVPSWCLTDTGVKP